MIVKIIKKSNKLFNKIPSLLKLIILLCYIILGNFLLKIFIPGYDYSENPFPHLLWVSFFIFWRVAYFILDKTKERSC